MVLSDVETWQTAMLKGILKCGEVKKVDMIIASAKSEKTREKIQKELGIQRAENNCQVLEFADVVFLAVKPQFLEVCWMRSKTA